MKKLAKNFKNPQSSSSFVRDGIVCKKKDIYRKSMAPTKCADNAERIQRETTPIWQKYSYKDHFKIYFMK